jgi:hypothetical protein
MAAGKIYIIPNEGSIGEDFPIKYELIAYP